MGFPESSFLGKKGPCGGWGEMHVILGLRLCLRLLWGQKSHSVYIHVCVCVYIQVCTAKRMRPYAWWARRRHLVCRSFLATRRVQEAGRMGQHPFLRPRVVQRLGQSHTANPWQNPD